MVCLNCWLLLHDNYYCVNSYYFHSYLAVTYIGLPGYRLKLQQRDREQRGKRMDDETFADYLDTLTDDQIAHTPIGQLIRNAKAYAKRDD